jgi:hypothetical protein
MDDAISMDKPGLTAPPDPHTRADVHRHGDAVEVVWHGKGCRWLIEQGMSQIVSAVENTVLGPPVMTYLIHNCLGVTGFDSTLREPAHALLTYGKSHGMKAIYVVTTSSAIRMVGRAVALAAGVKVHVTESTAEALESIKTGKRPG